MGTSDKEMSPFPIIRKRDGRLTRFDINKISDAIHQAFYAIGNENRSRCDELATIVVRELINAVEGGVPHVEEIQDAVERVLIKESHERAAKGFILYRAKRNSIREGKSELMDSVESILSETGKETRFGFNSTSAKMIKIAEAASRAFYLTRVIPSTYAEAHNRGDIHIHDLDYYSKTIQSLQIPVGRLFESGFSSGYGYTRPPRHISTIGSLLAIIIQSCQNDMQGGQSIPEFDRQVAGYISHHDNIKYSREELLQTMQGLVYNLNMIYSRIGEQVPQSTINLGLDTSAAGRMVTETLLTNLGQGLGRGETPLFPWVVFHIKDGVNLNEGDPNNDLLKLAVKVACRRMNPTFAFDDAPINQGVSMAYWGDASRTATDMPFSWDDDGNKPESISGWGNIAQVTINLPRVAFKVAHRRKDFQVESFRNELCRVIELCARQLKHRRDVISGLKVNELPFVMGEKIYSGSGELQWDDSISAALEHGILSIGFVGLAEAVMILYGDSYARDEKLLDFALETLDFMQEEIQKISREFESNLVLTASSSGYAAHRFPILDRGEFSTVPMVNDKKYYTQGFGLMTDEKIPWEKKLEIEGKFHNRVSGGHFTFLESSRMPDEETYLRVLKKMRESGIAYGGISFPLTESLDNGSIVTDPQKVKGRLRTIRRAAGLLLPLERINKGLREELGRRKFDL
ncbi:MAG: anaerobic ribonucleoside-triphosphate reductase [Candidatus Eremiobacteraeota bacterium]|nr:anaerobic ribonucleoside-triphosphate reductase [Candidatus Eremiobacteraeota bacterium]